MSFSSSLKEFKYVGVSSARDYWSLDNFFREQSSLLQVITETLINDIV